ncbi:hypothetical protein MPG10_03930 [Helicobacter pylori]|uniref:hypothetical protein n=1 Tax=Helicobacter pylori TaxID=210 RepID=UPI001FD48636|nr:hypothetical protein [Helicobacter pylori]UOR21603.1 hypothetical protein MPG10_03930 [Helicobacter pylori]
MQMLFDKINNGSPFGVIREVFSFSPQLRQFLNNKCHFIESLFFVYENEPSATFNLKNFLLVLAEYIYSGKICYCENKQDKNTHNIKSIRQSSAQNIKTNEIANDLESGKIVGEKIISDALLGVVSCCFMNDKNLKDLKKLLSQDQINLSNAITTAINNSFINEINLTSAIIDKIEYHFRDNTFHFIFNVSNNFLSGKSRLTIEVPRVALENIKLPDMKEIYVNQWYINIFINILVSFINKGFYILTGV